MSDWWSAAPLAPQGNAAPQSNYGGAISSIESGGNYRAVGPATRNGDRALGKYQVMSANVGPWSKEVLGQEITPTQFMASPEIQDRIFEAKFGSYVQKYGPEGAAKAWFAGEGGMNDPNRKDTLGTTVASYANKFMGSLGPSAANASERQPAPIQEDLNARPMRLVIGNQGAAKINPTDAAGDNSWWQNAPVAGQSAPSQPVAAPAAEPQPEQENDPGALGSFTRGAMNGLTFNFFDELSALTKAGASEGQPNMGVGALLTGLYKKISGDPEFAQKFEEALSSERGIDKAAAAQNPISNTLGQVAGALTMPVGGVLNAATLPARMGRGAAVGAGMGAAYGAGAGDVAADRVSGALSGGAIGGVVGGVAPAAIEGIVRGARGLGTGIANTVRGIRNPDDEAARRVAGAVQQDLRADPNAINRLTPQEFAASAQNGGPATVMDIGGETTRALARSAANTSPEGRQVLNNTINDRFEGQSGRVVGWLRRTFNFPDANAQQRALERVQTTVNRANYRRAYQDGDRSIWSPELERLTGSPAVETAMRSAITTGKDRAINEGMGGFRSPITITPDGRVSFNRGPNGVPTYPNLQFWDYVRREVSDAATAAQRAGRNEEGARLGQLARSLNAELDNLVPSYAAARAGAARFFGAENALEAGQNFVTQNFANAEARQALARMSPVERQLFQDGFVSRFIETLEKTGDRRSVLNQIGNSAAAREKLNIALGPQRAAELEAGLRVEGIMDLARSAVQGNSTTARQLAELGLAGGTYGLGTGGDILNPNPSALMNAALVYGAMRGKARIDTNVARRVADLLVSNDPRMLVRGIQILTRNQQLFNSLRSFDQSVARIGASQAPSSGAAQIPAIGRAEDQPEIPRPPGQ